MATAPRKRRASTTRSPWASDKPKRESLRGEKAEAILRAAAALFSVKGIEATSMEDVANALGVAKPTVYRLFRDKTALVEACFTRAGRPFLDLLEETRSRGGTATEQLRRYLSGDLHLMLEDDFGRMLMMPGVVDLYGERSQAYVRLMEQLRRGVREIILKGMRDGELKKSIDPNLLSLALFATFNRITRWYDPRGPYSPDDIANRYFDMFLDGVRAEP